MERRHKSIFTIATVVFSVRERWDLGDEDLRGELLEVVNPGCCHGLLRMESKVNYVGGGLQVHVRTVLSFQKHGGAVLRAIYRTVIFYQALMMIGEIILTGDEEHYEQTWNGGRKAPFSQAGA